MAPIQVVKASDEGTSSPFIARIFFGLLEMRDRLYLPQFEKGKRDHFRDLFDEKFKPLYEAAQATRDAASEIRIITRSHLSEIKSGKSVRFRKGHFEILQTINSQLNQSTDKLINQSIVATKTGLQSMLHDILGLDIGFLFQRDRNFNAGIATIKATGEHDLAQYLEKVRVKWHSDLQELRTKKEHEGWSLDRVKYHLKGPSEVTATLPTVLGMPVDVFSRHTANRVLLFIENMMAFAMQRKCKLPVFLVEIPPKQRDPKNIKRFRIAAKGLDKNPPWKITYQDNMDFI